MRFPFSARAAALAAATVFGLGVAAALPQAARAQIVVSNPGTFLVQGWGNSVTATIGQTITAPVGSTGLSSFTFTLSDQYRIIPAGPGPVAYKAYVYAWNETTNRIIGDALFASDTLMTPDTTPANYPDPITIDTSVGGGTPLTAGNRYVLFFSTSGLQTTSPKGQYIMYANGSDTYTGGKFVYMNNSDNFGLLSTSSWTAAGAKDLRFTATFTGTAAGAPEPGSLALLLMGGGVPGFAALRACRRLRRTRQIANKN